MPFSFFASPLVRDFSRMGSRIAERHQRCASWWEAHVHNTREFIKLHLPEGARVAVLGAGRMIDIDARALLCVAREAHLLDADKGCLRAWRAALSAELRKKVVPRIEDITCCLRDWTSKAQRAAKRGSLEQELLAMSAPRPGWADEPFDAVISLNLLGQIPLYWRDFVRNQFGLLSVDEERALIVSMGELQRAHLDGLLSSKAAIVMAITDTEYYFYEASDSNWRVEEALFGQAQEVFNSWRQAGRRLRAQDTWLWHLAPQFIEQEDEGEIHKVEAFVWTEGGAVSKNSASCEN